MKSPCYGCSKRELNCHSNCEEYLTYRSNRDKLLETQKKEHEIYSLLARNAVERKTKVLRKKNKKAL